MVERKLPPVWLFALAALPYGIVGAYSQQVMPYLVRESGLDVDSIGWYSLILFIPPMLQFLYAPIVDIGIRRKHWHVIVTTISAIAIVITCTIPVAERPVTYMVFAVIAQLVSGLVGSCNGGLMAMMVVDAKRGKAGAWLNIGNISGGAIAGAIAIVEIYHKVEPILVGLTLAGMMMIGSLAVLTVAEPARPQISGSELFRTTLSDVRKVLFSKQGITGVLLCLSPVGTAALVNTWTALGKDYGVTGDHVAFMSGPVSAGITAIGAGVGGWLCDRYNRRFLYLAAGVLTAIVGGAMTFSPVTATTFDWGVAAYSLATGFSYAAFTATVLETIGEGGTAAATQYTLFVAAGNAAISYVGFASSRFHESYGVVGMTGSDALLNLGGVVVLGFVFWRLGAFARKPDRLQETLDERSK